MANSNAIDAMSCEEDRPVVGGIWPNSCIVRAFDASTLVVEPTDPGDRFVQVWMADEQSEPGVRLTREQCHTLALSLMARALIMDEGE